MQTHTQKLLQSIYQLKQKHIEKVHFLMEGWNIQEHKDFKKYIQDFARQPHRVRIGYFDKQNNFGCCLALQDAIEFIQNYQDIKPRINKEIQTVRIGRLSQILNPDTARLFKRYFKDKDYFAIFIIQAKEAKSLNDIFADLNKQDFQKQDLIEQDSQKQGPIKQDPQKQGHIEKDPQKQNIKKEKKHFFYYNIQEMSTNLNCFQIKIRRKHVYHFIKSKSNTNTIYFSHTKKQFVHSTKNQLIQQISKINQSNTYFALNIIHLKINTTVSDIVNHYQIHLKKTYDIRKKYKNGSFEIKFPTKKQAKSFIQKFFRYKQYDLPLDYINYRKFYLEIVRKRESTIYYEYNRINWDYTFYHFEKKRDYQSSEDFKKYCLDNYQQNNDNNQQKIFTKQVPLQVRQKIYKILDPKKSDLISDDRQTLYYVHFISFQHVNQNYLKQWVEKNTSASKDLKFQILTKQSFSEFKLKLYIFKLQFKQYNPYFYFINDLWPQWGVEQIKYIILQSKDPKPFNSKQKAHFQKIEEDNSQNNKLSIQIWSIINEVLSENYQNINEDKIQICQIDPNQTETITTIDKEIKQ